MPSCFYLFQRGSMPEEKPRKKIKVVRMACACIWRGPRRFTIDPTCPVAFHSDQIDLVFDELGVTSDILDK